MKNLKELLVNIDYELVKGSLDVNVRKVRDNSQKVEEGDLFLALIGTTANSHKFIPDAVERGAKVIVIRRRNCY